MRSSTVLVVLSAAFATTSAARLEARQSGYASCALPCLTSVDRGSCDADDTKCLCLNQQFVEQANVCVHNSCSGDDLTKSVAAALEMCRSVGVTLSSSASGPTSTTQSSSTSSSPTPSNSSSESSKNSAGSNSINVLFALSALGLIGCAL